MSKEEFYVGIELLLLAINEIRDNDVYAPEYANTIYSMYLLAISVLEKQQKGRAI